jgi:hypothetical protein
MKKGGPASYRKVLSATLRKALSATLRKALSSFARPVQRPWTPAPRPNDNDLFSFVTPAER